MDHKQQDIKQQDADVSTMAPSEIAALPDYQLIDGKYFIKTKKLGMGNFAQTYIATYKEDQTQVLACKMITKARIIQKLKASQTNEQAQLRKDYLINSLKNEVQLWKKLDQPNIVRFIDFSETSNNIYFFLEYCDGGDLEKLLNRKGKLQELDGASLFKEIVDGAAFLYEKGIFHRDLKPENILIHQEHAQIADFGFAKVLEEDEKDTAKQGTSVGTPFYMAPQVLAGDSYSIKCDVWSLGVMYYQILYGFLPWNEQNTLHVLLQSMKNIQLDFPPSVPVTDTSQDLIRHMLTVDESARIGIKQVQEILAGLIAQLKV